MEEQAMSACLNIRPLACLATLVVLSTAPLTLAAQQPQPEPQKQHVSKECPGAPAEASEPSTATETGPHSGTKNIGSTGWSGGGLGGSHNDTVPKGPAPTSETWQPPTASGLDPFKHKNEPAC
jgi:hypothetical protein